MYQFAGGICSLLILKHSDVPPRQLEAPYFPVAASASVDFLAEFQLLGLHEAFALLHHSIHSHPLDTTNTTKKYVKTENKETNQIEKENNTLVSWRQVVCKQIVFERATHQQLYRAPSIGLQGAWHQIISAGLSGTSERREKAVYVIVTNARKLTPNSPESGHWSE